MEGQRLPNTILLECQLNRPGRAFVRNGHFNPQLLAALERRRVSRVLGDVEIHRLFEAQCIAGVSRPRPNIHALLGQIRLWNPDRHQLVVFNFELGAELNG